MAVMVQSIGLKGLEGYTVSVEVEKLEGVESMVIIGLPGAAVKESKERVLAALKGFQCDLADQKVIIHLSPAEERKNGALFDLAIAVAMLRSTGEIKKDIPADTAFIGAISLNGAIHPGKGILPAILAAGKSGIRRLFLPNCSLPIREIEGLELVFVEHLKDVVDHLSGQPVLPLSCPAVSLEEELPSIEGKDFQHIIGHGKAKRALEIAAAGGHNVLMAGPPGCGKSLLAESMPSIMPQLWQEAQLENISLYELAGAPLTSRLLPPFRQPHHSASAVSIIGGGSNPRPGEVSLANHGILFLDEMAEFTKKTLDMLRQPLETGKVTISRAQMTVTYPARFLLLAATNPCPCGYLGSHTRYCTCTPRQIQAYQSRISGPIEDRIDILLSLLPIPFHHGKPESNESSEQIRNRVSMARERQYERYGKMATNSFVAVETFMSMISLSEGQKRFLHNLAQKQHWSNRVHMKMIRLARTISDLRGENSISDESLWEAVTLRRTHLQNQPAKKGSWKHGS